MSFFSDKLEGFSGFLQLLSKIDVGDIRKVYELSRMLSSEDTKPLGKVKCALALADVLTDYTPGERDDQVVDALKRMAESDAAEELVGVIEVLLSGGKVTESFEPLVSESPRGLPAPEFDDHGDEIWEEPTGELDDDGAEIFQTKAIPWSVVYQVSHTVVQLIKLFR